jgi:hypothetical protein
MLPAACSISRSDIGMNPGLDEKSHYENKEQLDMEVKTARIFTGGNFE